MSYLDAPTTGLLRPHLRWHERVRCRRWRTYRTGATGEGWLELSYTDDRTHEEYAIRMPSEGQDDGAEELLLRKIAAVRNDRRAAV